MGLKRSGSKGFITEAERQVIDFYRDVQRPERRTREAPKLPEPAATEAQRMGQRRAALRAVSRRNP
jgi:hypothetical protein